MLTKVIQNYTFLVTSSKSQIEIRKLICSDTESYKIK